MTIHDLNALASAIYPECPEGAERRFFARLGPTRGISTIRSGLCCGRVNLTSELQHTSRLLFNRSQVCRESEPPNKLVDKSRHCVGEVAVTGNEIRFNFGLGIRCCEASTLDDAGTNAQVRVIEMSRKTCLFPGIASKHRLSIRRLYGNPRNSLEFSRWRRLSVLRTQYSREYLQDSNWAQVLIPEPAPEM